MKNERIDLQRTYLENSDDARTPLNFHQDGEKILSLQDR